MTPRVLMAPKLCFGPLFGMALCFIHKESQATSLVFFATGIHAHLATLCIG